MDTVNTELIRGHVDTIILNSLLEQDRYGYEILDMISDLSEGRYEIKQPTLYSCLKRLEKQGFISSYFGEESNGGRRRYYKLTEKGKETLEQDQREWEFSRTIINKLLSDKEIDLRTVEAPFDTSELRPLTRRVRAHEPREENVDVIPPTQAPIIKYVFVRVGENASIPEGCQTVSPSEIPVGAIITDSPNIVETAGNVEVTQNTDEREPMITVTQQEAMNALYGTTSVVDDTTVNDTADSASQAILPQNSEENVEPEQVAATVETTPISSLNQVELSAEEEERAVLVKQQQENASRLLEIGDFARPRNLIDGEEVAHSAQENASIPYANLRTTEEMNENFNYREALSAIFGATQENEDALNTANAVHQAEIERIENSSRARQFGDVKQSLENDGFKLKVYQKNNTINHYYMRFIYSNRLNRDTTIFTYLLLIAELLIMIIAKNAFGNPIPYIIFGAIAILLPIIPTAIWAINPLKRVRAQFNLNQSLANSLIIFIVITAITIVISLLLDVNMKLGSTYAPIIISANIPLGVLIYGILYKSNNYHLKK